ncbi:UbiA family prenyltransferase [Anditalea andensis]|uniref:Ubiquinone biosynthesis protein UbiA n=1 Tax=Anditalea andensis TaxID=1048983 RepID=A0A074KXF6_9BACT|nr:UbiA family prenyltransferase [Anditalea andensis]KEO73609.1 ubiquinone biosynthesis protein UbiA [Anditalea andensis]
MFRLSNWRHLRVSFSFYLLPVFIFALAHTPNLDPYRLWIVFFALHFFLYPSSNGYNSYYDKDEGSIGGLKHPPKVSRGLYYLSFVFLGIALMLGLQINIAFTAMMGLYAVVSMAYSHPSIRLKKYPIAGWLVAGMFQGYFTYAMVYAGLNGFGWHVLSSSHVYIPGMLTSIMIWGNYPLTQVYQHEEDSKRGDITMSIKLGIKGTFYFSSLWFLLAGLGFSYYFIAQNQFWAFWAFLAAMFPSVIYFYVWFYFVNKDAERYASYAWAMWMVRIAATLLNLFFVYYFLERTQLLQVIDSGF